MVMRKLAWRPTPVAADGQRAEVVTMTLNRLRRLRTTDKTLHSQHCVHVKGKVKSPVTSTKELIVVGRHDVDDVALRVDKGVVLLSILALQ